MIELHDEYVLKEVRHQSSGTGPSLSGTEHFGYTEPFRRFVQRESFSPQANEIPNTAPSWLPGDDYYTNFHVGDPYIKVDQGFARLPGAGYQAIHPELKNVNPEDYPDIHKMAILVDVAPYSREYQVLPSCLHQNTSRARRRPAPLPSLTSPPTYLHTCLQACPAPRIRSWF